ncbi:MAG: hypothetical protein V4618_13390 [Pseudomonadota bacterium]
MSSKPTIGRRLIVLKEYSGLSLAQIAKRGGYAGASSIQKLFKPNYDPPVLPKHIADRLARALVGCGDPPIEQLEISSLAGEGTDIEHRIAELSVYTHMLSRFIPLFHTRRLNAYVTSEQSEEIPLFSRVESNDGLHFACPDHLKGLQLIGLYITIGTMWPRFAEGEVVLYEHRRPPSPGDDVLVTVVTDADQNGGMIIGRLYLMHDDEVQIDLLSPRHRIVLERRNVISVHRLVTPSDLLPPPTSVF